MQARVAVLGQLEVTVDGNEVDVPAGRPRRLLSMLALRANEVVPVAALIDALWDGRPTPSSRKALQLHVSQLRRVLPDGSLITRGGGYSLAMSADELDVLAFVRDLAAGRTAQAAGDHREAADRLGAALAWWRSGDGMDVPEALGGELERLRDEREDARERWLACRLELGEDAEALADLRGARGEHPYREGLVALEMRALYRAGRAADALALFADARRRLDEDLGLRPGPALLDLQRAVLANDPALLASAAPGSAGASRAAGVPRTVVARAGGLPAPVTSLIGRDAELSELARRLTRSPSRLVTVTGPGGVGKTRLAMACGLRLRDRFTDGVFVVRLAPVADPADLLETMLDALGAPRRPEGDELSLVEHLRARETLLVVDNFEHLVDAAPVIGRLLEAAPRLRVLITSQAPLRLRAESVLALGPLALPDPGERDLDRLVQAPAVALFLDRARAADPAFRLTVTDAVALSELCQRLDGLPLALELAAARVRLAGVPGLRNALRDGVDALGYGARDLPERQRGLRAALDYTVSLLDDDARDLFLALGAFAGPWTLDQVTRAFGDGIDVWEAMQALLDFSLVSDAGESRLTMAERVRTHARELLAASGRLPERRHEHAVAIAEIAEGLSIGHARDHASTTATARELREEFEHALSYTRDRDPEVHRRLIAWLARLLFFTGRLARIADDIDRLAAADSVRDVTAGQIMSAKAMLQCQRGDMAGTARWAARAAACHRATADRETLLATLTLAAHAHTLAHDGHAARAIVSEGLALLEDDSDPRFVDLFHGTLAFAAVAEESYDEAEQRLQEILDRPGRTDFAAVVARSYLASCAVGRGEGEVALGRYQAALRMAVDRDEITNIVMQLTGIAASLVLLDRPEEAARMAGAVSRVERELGSARGWHGVLAPDVILAELPARLGPERWQAQHDAGSRLTLAETLEHARAITAGAATPPRRSAAR